MGPKSPSAPRPQLYTVKFDTYLKYRNELENIKKLHSSVLDQIRSLHYKPVDIIRAKSERAKSEVTSTADFMKIVSKIKFKQIKSLLEKNRGSAAIAKGAVTEALNSAWDKFHEETKEARSSVEKIVAQNTENALADILNDDGVDCFEIDLDKMKDSYLKTVEDAWKTFKDEASKDTDVSSAASRFAEEIDAARKKFGENALAIVVEIFNVIDETAKNEFHRTVNGAVGEYFSLMLSAQQYFHFKLDQLVQGVKTGGKFKGNNLPRHLCVIKEEEEELVEEPVPRISEQEVEQSLDRLEGKNLPKTKNRRNKISRWKRIKEGFFILVSVF